MTPAFVMSIILGIACCGISLDLGMIEVYRIKMQNAADAAALGGQVSHDQEDTSWANNGVLDAQQNGFTNGSNGVTVSVTQGPTSGPYSGDYDAVQATVTKSFQPIFIGTKMTITATAASLETPCVFATGAYSPSWTSYPVTVQLGSSIGRFGGSTMGCPVYYNKGLYEDSTSSLWENSFVSSGSSGQSIVTGGINPHAPRYNAPAVTDPLSYLTQPTVGSCPAANTSVTLIGVTKTLSPGTYCKGLTFLNSTITLSPGLYVICDGASWTSSTVTGNGVTLFFSQSGDGKYGQFISTHSSLYLSAPVDSSNGGTPGMLFWADRAWAPTAAQDFQFLYGYGPVGDGIYYTTNTGILINAETVSGTHYLCFDTDNLNVIAAALQPMGNFTVLATGNPFKGYIGGLVQ